MGTHIELSDEEQLQDIAALIHKLSPNESLLESVRKLTNYQAPVESSETTTTTPLPLPVPSPATPENLVAALKLVIEASNALFTVSENREIESPFRSIIHISSNQKPEIEKELGKLLLTTLSSNHTDGRALERLRIISIIFNNLEATSPRRFDTFKVLIQFAGKTGQISVVDLDFEKLASWISQWGLTATQTRELYRLIYEVLLECKKSLAAHRFLEKLLLTFDNADAQTLATVKEDAKKCIIEAVASPFIFQLDSLLQLAAVKQLEGTDVHKLLLVFVKENLEAYEQFYASNSKIIESFGLSHETNLFKMRLLTLATLATEASSSEVDFSNIATTLKVPQAEVENWVIEAISAKLIEAKIDQTQKKIIIGRATHRVFGKPQWQQLSDRLNGWNGSLNEILTVIRAAKAQAQAIKNPQSLATAATTPATTATATPASAH